MRAQQNKLEGIKIIAAPSAENQFLVLYKCAGIPTAPLAKNCHAEKSALEQAISLFPQIKDVRGKLAHEFGLLHRIDTATSGLVLVATTQLFYDALCKSQQDGLFEKQYSAKCSVDRDNALKLGGFPPPPKLPFSFPSLGQTSNCSFVAKSFFRTYGKGGAEVRPVTALSNAAAKKKSGRILYETRVEVLMREGAGMSASFTVRCFLKRGFRHQVRCHLAWCGLPILGDQVYNHEARSATSRYDSDAMAFEACCFSFPHPVTKKPVSFSVDDLMH